MSNDKLKSYNAVLSDKAQSIEGLSREMMEVLSLLDDEKVELSTKTSNEIASKLLSTIKNLDTSRSEIANIISDFEGKIADPDPKSPV